MEIFVFLFAIPILILSLVIFYVVWRLKSERRQGISSFGWLLQTTGTKPCQKAYKESEDVTTPKRENAFNFVERAEANPRDFLKKILANEKVIDELYVNSMSITNITDVKDSRGQFKAELKWEHGAKPVSIHILVFPSALSTLFCLQAWEEDNSWLPKMIEEEDDLDPEIPERAVNTFSSFFNRLTKAISEAGLFQWPSDKR